MSCLWPALCVAAVLVAWRLWRAQSRRGIDDVQRAWLALLAEQARQADDRAIADNLDI